MQESTEIEEHNFYEGNRVKQHPGSMFYDQSKDEVGTITSIRNRSLLTAEWTITVNWDHQPFSSGSCYSPSMLYKI